MDKNVQCSSFFSPYAMQSIYTNLNLLHPKFQTIHQLLGDNFP